MTTCSAAALSQRQGGADVGALSRRVAPIIVREPIIVQAAEVFVAVPDR